MFCSDIGALIVAEMSSAGSLATGSYTAGCLAMAAQRTEVVAGLISQSRLSQVCKRGGNAIPPPPPAFFTAGVYTTYFTKLNTLNEKMIYYATLILLPPSSINAFCPFFFCVFW
jgi:hypothetical protein